MQDTPNQQEFSLKRFFIPLTTKKAIHIIAIVGFIVYFNMLFNGFVWDDYTYIIRNLYTYHINLFYAFGNNLFNNGGQYRPIPELYFSILCTAFANAPFIYHFLQLVLHIICTIIIFIFFQKYFSKGITLFLSIVFLVHPINIEAVSYIAQTINPLFFLFGALSLLLSMNENLSGKKLVIIFSLALLSLLTKETGILFVCMILIYSFLFLKNNLSKLSIGSFITISLYAFIRIFIGQVDISARPVTPIASLSLFERLLNMPMIMFYYLKTSFFPKTLATDQQWVITSLHFSTLYLPLIIDLSFIAFITLVGIYTAKHHKQFSKPFFFFSAWLVLGFLMIAQIFPLDMTVADRWFYFPLVGLLGIFGIICQIIIHKLKMNASVIVFIAIIIVLSLSVRTIIRNNDWHDVFTLYNYDILISDNFDIENDLGVEYLNINKYSDALKHLTISISQRPNELNLQNMGATYGRMGDFQKAEKYYELALHAKQYQLVLQHKHYLLTYRNYAPILVYYDDPNKANDFLEEAVKDYPDSPDSSDLWKLLALTKLKLHDKQAALDAIKKAYQLDPTNQEIVFVYSHILANQSFIMNIDGKKYKFN